MANLKELRANQEEFMDPVQTNQNLIQGQTQPAGQNQPGTQAQPAQGQAADEPKWLSFITDEAAKKEAREGYLKDADYRQKTTKLADDRRGWESEKAGYEQKNRAWQEWFDQKYQPWVESIKPYLPYIEQMQRGQQPQDGSQQQGQPGAQDAATQFANWDLLPPEQKALQLAQYVHQRHVAPSQQQFAQQVIQTISANLAEREKYYQNYLNLQTDALLKKVADPNFDVAAYMQNALKIQQGQIDPMKMAYTMTTAAADQQKIQDEWFKKGKEEAKLELQNQNQVPGVTGSGALSSFLQQRQQSNGNQNGVEATVRKVAAQAGIPWVAG